MIKCSRIDCCAPFSSTPLMISATHAVGYDLDRRGRAATALQHLSQHGFPWGEGLHAAVLQDQKLIEPASIAIGRCATTTTMAPRSRAARIARVSASSPLGIEIGVRLIQDNKERIAVERPRQRHALRLPADSAVPAHLSGCRSRRAS